MGAMQKLPKRRKEAFLSQLALLNTSSTFFCFLGDASEPIQKRLKTVHTDDSQSIEENETKESNAEMYQHIKEAQEHTEQVTILLMKQQRRV